MTRSLDDREMARVAMLCAQYSSADDNDDERVAAVVAAQLRDLPRRHVYPCAVHQLRARREESRRRWGLPL